MAPHGGRGIKPPDGTSPSLHLYWYGLLGPLSWLVKAVSEPGQAAKVSMILSQQEGPMANSAQAWKV